MSTRATRDPFARAHVEVGDHLAAVAVDVGRARHAGAEHPGAGEARAAQHVRHRELDVAVTRVVGVRPAADVDDAGCAAQTGPRTADGAQVGAGTHPHLHVAVVRLQAADEAVAERFQGRRAQQRTAGIRAGFEGKYHCPVAVS